MNSVFIKKGNLMKQWKDSKSFVLLLISVVLTVCLSGYSSTSNKLSGDDCRPNYTLDNGQKLLGNNNYMAVSYSGYRTRTRTVENCPTVAEFKEDMKILSAMGIKLLRTYDTQEFPQADRLLQAISELRKTDPDFEMYAMLGAWIRCQGAYGPAPDHSAGDIEWNKKEIDAAIELARQYPDIVKIVAVGNEAMVTWQAHFVPAATILKWVNYLKEARTTGQIPAKTLVTTSDNWAALGGEERYRSEDLKELMKQMDFVSLHTYAFHDTFYNQELKWGPLPNEVNLPAAEQAAKSVERAIAEQKVQYNAVKDYLRSIGIDKEIHIGETGWASLDNSHYGDEGTCAASEYTAKLFYDAAMKWTKENNLTCFYFEAFDEPWKSNGTDGSEGHFGLFTVEGKAKYMLWNLVDSGVFNGLTRGGNQVVKTHNGSKTILLENLKAPRHKKN
jgi:exo-beta-1,3-glucanase (GH17 family)